jgi:prolipoprotein diacylglyceryl transferase
MLLSIVWDIDPTIVQLGGFSLRYYGLCWVIAFALGCYVLNKVYIREKIPVGYLESLCIYVCIGTVAGARLGHCLFYEDAGFYLTHPIELIMPLSKKANGSWVISGYAGLASHGGAVGILIALSLYAYIKKVNFWNVTDKLGIVAPLSGCFIRLGNLFNSEIIGKPSDVPWAFVFGRIDGTPRHPSQLYEALGYLAIFLFIYPLYTRHREKHRQGFYFALSLSLIFVIRFLLEYTKEVQEPFELTLRQSYGMDMGQLLSLPFIIAGVFLLLIKRKPK